jgi:hypothetical protein
VSRCGEVEEMFPGLIGAIAEAYGLQVARAAKGKKRVGKKK